MTPLARWVLLATFFGHATSVPARIRGTKEYACAALCRAENAAANEDKVHVIPWHQSADGRRGREAARLLGLCLERPKHGSVCRILIQSLREYRKCDCEEIERSLLPTRIYVFSSLLDDLLEDYSDVSEVVQLKLEEKGEKVNRLGSRKNFMEKESKFVGKSVIERENFKAITSASIMDADGKLVSGTPDADSSDSDSVDWEMWCMAQCDIGHGGSACECDIIP